MQHSARRHECRTPATSTKSGRNFRIARVPPQMGTNQRCAARRKLRAASSVPSSGPSLVAVASVGGSNDEPALCQTPATSPTHRRSDRESVAARMPTPSKWSRPSTESGGAESQIAASNWLRGTGSSVFDVGLQNHRSEATSGPDPGYAPSNRRSSLGTFAHHQTKNRARSQQVRIGWCGAASRSGRATSLVRIASQFTIRETETPENSGSLQVEDDRNLTWCSSAAVA